MVAAQKAERESEETWDWVQTRTVMTTKPVEGTAKMNQQLAKLTAALIQTG